MGGGLRQRVWVGLGIALGGLLLVAALGAALLFLPRNSDGPAQLFRIAPGESFGQVETRLVTHGLVRRGTPLRLWARVTGQERAVRHGTYRLSPMVSPAAILESLAAGRVVLRRVTLPEGLTVPQALDRLGEALDLGAAALTAASRDSAWLVALGLPVANLEGYLFPETYYFPYESRPHEVLATLVRATQARFDAARRARAESLGLAPHAVLTLASIVEAETAQAAERPRVAAVYLNRLRLGWLLQADPTVAYALGRPGRPLNGRDLEVDSPYNTYLHAGLPPGPICSPGLASIEAVLTPEAGCADLYFVARGDGTHAFSRTLEEHNGARRGVQSAP